MPTIIVVAEGMVVVMAMEGGCVADPGGSAVTGGGGDSGVQGELVVDGGGPVMRESGPWRVFPLRGTVEAVPSVLSAGGAEARTESDARGLFRLVLPPGEYVLRARNLTGAPVPAAWPVTVRVTAGAFTEVTIHFDSGVR
jgi:hypothetical protein